MLQQLLKLVSIFTLVGIIAAEKCPPDSDKMHSAEVNLRNKLLCNYDVEIRPVKSENRPVPVDFNLYIRYIETNDDMQYGDTITVFSWLVLAWPDEYLAWNETENNNLNAIRVNSDKIWIPEIYLFDGYSSMVDSNRKFSSDCMVHSIGLVMCVIDAIHTAICDSDITRWPYDSQECTMVFRTDIKGEIISLNAGYFVEVNGRIKYKENPSWRLQHLNATTTFEGTDDFNNNYTSLSYSMTLQRQSAILVTQVTTPAIIMISLTLMSLVIKVTSSHRIYLLAADILCHFLYLEHLTWFVPSHGDTCPLVVRFYRDSMVLNAAVLMLTAVLKMLVGQSTSVPNWIDTVIAMSNSVGGRWIMFGSEDNGDKDKILVEDTEDQILKAEQRNQQDWKQFVQIVNRMLLLGTAGTYFGMFVGMILF